VRFCAGLRYAESRDTRQHAAREIPAQRAEARGFEPRMGANPNRIGSPFGQAKAAVSHRHETESAQVGELRPAGRLKPPEPTGHRVVPHLCQGQERSVPQDRQETGMLGLSHNGSRRIAGAAR
jgi:hypothetical protein